jgi:CBS domain containing-hemolysin-like protein
VTAAILTSAMCSLFEAVLYSVPVSHIEALSQKGRSAGRILKRLRRDVDRPIAAILSLNTIANTAGAAVAGAAASAVFGHERLAYFSAAFTLAILLLSEVVPKTAGVVFNRSLAPLIARPLQVLVWVFTPLVWLCRGVTHLISRHRTEPGISDEELIIMARTGLQAGTMRTDEVQVIENILALERKKASDIMTPRTVMVALDQSLSVDEARQVPGVLAHSRIPVYDKTPDDMIGIAFRRDILTASADGRAGSRVAELIRPVHFVTDSVPLDELLRMLLELRQHIVVAIDDHGGVAGILTLEDVLEEILGTEIIDELDEVADMREVARRRREKLLGDRPS